MPIIIIQLFIMRNYVHVFYESESWRFTYKIVVNLNKNFPVPNSIKKIMNRKSIRL